MDAVKYLGHGARTGGLQQHSVDDSIYPYIVYAQETAHGTLWGVTHANGDFDTGAKFTCAHAHSLARSVRQCPSITVCYWKPDRLGAGDNLPFNERSIEPERAIDLGALINDTNVVLGATERFRPHQS